MKSIFTALIFINILCIITLAIINLTLRRNPYLIKSRIGFFLLCLCFISMRMFLPFNFPFTYIYSIYEILPPIYLFLYNTTVTINDCTLNLFGLFNIIWAAGSAICLFRLCYKYISAKRNINNLDKYDNHLIYPIIDKILSNYKRPINFSIVYTEKVMSPFIFGIFRPYIVLPKTPTDNEDIYYILSHEIAHYYHGDLLIKLIIEVVHAVYWWNPLFYPIKAQLSTLLEINADAKVTGRLNKIETFSYMQCLLKTAKFREKFKENNFAPSFNKNSTSAISKRIHILLDNFKISKLHNCINMLTIMFLLIITLIMPNFFTITSIAGEGPGHVYDPEVGYFEIRKDNAFYVELEDGTYDLYVDQYFMINLPSTELIETKIPIYSSLAEVPIK